VHDLTVYFNFVVYYVVMTRMRKLVFATCGNVYGDRDTDHWDGIGTDSMGTGEDLRMDRMVTGTGWRWGQRSL